MLDWLSGLRKAFGQNEAKKEAKKASEKAQKTLDTIQLSNAEELYNKGRSAAGVAAGDMAAHAKKQAKASATMNNASKTMAGIQGAAAANDAVTKGYIGAATNAANMEAGQEGNKAAITKAKASAQQHEGDLAAQEAMNNTNHRWNAVGNITKLFGSN